MSQTVLGSPGTLLATQPERDELMSNDDDESLIQERLPVLDLDR